MQYEDAISTIVTKEKALSEIRKHHLDPNEFLAETGDKSHYSGKEVLDWLGY